MPRKHIIRHTLVAFVAASLASAALAADLHVGASIGRSDYRVDTTGAASADTQDSAGKLFIGASFTPHLGVEAAFFDLGTAKGTVVVPVIGSVDTSAGARGVGFTGVVSAPIGPVSPFAKGGAAYVRTRLSTSVSTGLPDSESSWQPTLGMGLSYAFARQLAVRGEWERVRARFPGGERENVDLLSIGLSYRF